MNSLLTILLSEFKEQYDNLNLIPRDYQFPQLENKIKVAIGMRRVGKTYFLFQTIQQIIREKNVPWERFLYLNFEDDRLLPCSQEKLRELLESFYENYPDNHNHTCYLMLDEIQNVENWALVIRRFFDTKKVQIYLTGSSAKLLSKEIATSLRGRSIAIEIWPYSFSEYLKANQIQYEKGMLGQKDKDFFLHYLKNYIEQGGFPETTGTQSADRRQVLQDYTELVIMRDIVERYNITNISLIKYLINTLMKNAGGSFSVNKFVNDIKSQGFTGAKNTIYDYLEYIEDAYLSFLTPLFSESIRKVSTNPRKIYAIDTGLVKAFSFSLNKNYGHLFENMLYLDFRRRGYRVYYYLTQERYEVDFLIEDRVGERRLYQVVWDASDQETMKREERGLNAAMQELKVPGLLITPEMYVRQLKSDNGLDFL